MPHINTAERIGIEKGLLLGRQEGLQEGLQNGRHEGLQQARRQVAQNLIGLGTLDDEQIAAATQLDLLEVRALRQQLDGPH